MSKKSDLPAPESPTANGAGERSQWVDGYPLHSPFQFDLRAMKGSVMVSALSDSDMKKGGSDRPGDHMEFAAAVRVGTPRDNVVVAADARLYTDPSSNPNHIALSRLVGTVGANTQRDTAKITATIGREKPLSPNLDTGIYVTGGIQNGAAYDALVGLKTDLHHMSGMGNPRVSPTSTGERVIARISGRLDQSVLELNHGRVQAQLVGTVGANVGTDTREAMAAGYLWLGQNVGNIFHPNLPGMPAQDNRGTGVYAGIRAEAKQYDVETHHEGTKPLGVSTELGAVIDIAGRALVNFSVTHEPRRLVEKQALPSSSTVRAGLTIPF